MAPPRSTPLPTGTVTFLFTDIEGSTRLLQSLGDRYLPVLEAHHDELRAAVEHHAGIVVNTEGDAVFAVFTSAPDAIGAATEAQRALADHDWPDGGTVRVRMGIHTGIGRLGGDDYAGLDVHRAARIAAAAHGGQILVSATTKALTEGALPGSAGFRDLGEHRLKDLDAPERLFQVSIPDLPSDFPRPRSLEVPISLPASLTTFVGREDEIERVWDAFTHARLVTLTGPGGTGKSRLAAEVARRHADAFLDGVRFVALETLQDPSLVPSAIVQALGLREAGRPPDQILSDHLASREVLLILDNFEQLRPAATFVISLLGAAPRLRLLVTSRVALGIGGEQEQPIGPLSLPSDARPPSVEALLGFDAIRLFVDRARASQPSFALDAENASAVAEICGRLDGLPLAIELAAARVKLFPPDAILARLEHRLDLLTTQSPTLPARQRSLRGAIEWSFDLLSAPEQRLFERLAVFAGGWDLSTAEAVCRPAELRLDIVDGLSALLDQSLILRAGDRSTRYGMLLTIQAFARERLEAEGDAADVDRRHAAHFRDLAEAIQPDLVGSDPGAAVSRLAPDQDNLRAALDWAIRTGDADLGLRLAAALWRYWQARGQLREGRQWLERLLAMPEAEAPTRRRAEALTALGGIAYWQGDVSAGTHYREALEIRRSLDDPQGIADALQDLAFSVMTVRLDEGMELFRESLARYRDLGDERNIASVVGALGYGEMISGHLPEARVALEEGLALNLAHGIRGRANDNRMGLGHLHRMSGDLETAAGYYDAALADTRSIGDAARMLMMLEAVVVWASAAGRHREAVRLAAAIGRARASHGGSISIPVPGRTDPVAEARGAKVDETEIAAAMDDGSRLDLAEAVDAALALLEGARGPRGAPVGRP